MEFLTELGVFNWAIIIGLAVLALSFFIDGVLEDFLFDGFVPVISIFLVCFGVSGMIGNNLGIEQSFFFGVIAAFIGLLVAFFFYLFYKSFKKHGERVALPLSAHDMIGVIGKVIWWSDGVGEVNISVRGTNSRLSAYGDESEIANGSEVEVIDLDGRKVNVVSVS